MRISGDEVRRQIAICLVMIFITVPFVEATSSRAQEISPSQQAESPFSTASASSQKTSDTSTNADAIPSAPQANNSSPDSSKIGNSGPQAGASPSIAPSAPKALQANPAPPPLGTATAPYTKSTGVAASRPSGAVIAPAKQRRVRSILIRVGLLVGAGVAIGTVAALSLSGASYSRRP